MNQIKEKRIFICHTWPVLVRAVISCGLLAGVLLWGGEPLWLALLAGIGLPAVSLVRVVPPERVNRILSRVLWAAGPIVALCLVETMNGNGVSDLKPLEIVLNLVWYYMIAGLLFLILGRRNCSARWTAVLFFAIGAANHYIVHFRGRAIMPVDLLTLRTAANVAGSYSYAPCAVHCSALLLLLIYLLPLRWLPASPPKRPKWMISAGGIALSLGYLAVFFCTPMIDALGIEPSLWTTRGNGFVLNFTVCLKYSRIEQPEGYDPENIRQVMQEQEESAEELTGTVPTNIIVIMDEAFSELSVLGDLTTTADDLPFLHSLTENTIKGHAYSSVFGGTTANSEYEFLTGNSMAFFPAGAVPYQLSVRPGDYSLVDQLSSLGYSTTAMHPYKRSGWNRTAVYANFGFDNVMFQDDFQDVTYVRDYISDESDFQNLIRLYEEKEDGEPMFLFNVTMQNHSAYNLAWTNLEQSVSLDGDLKGTSNWANQYLSLVHATDQAFEGLIDYFSQVEEPTLILIFGDHQPQLADTFYEKLMGASLEELTPEESEKRYETVFALWANYDIPEAEDVDLSINYLSTLLMEVANLPMTGYQKYQSQLMEELPVINAGGFITADGTYHEKVEELAGDLQDQVNLYQQMQYNGIADRDKRVDEFFYLDSPDESS